jgi:biotin transport system substrate-specific component
MMMSEKETVLSVKNEERASRRLSTKEMVLCALFAALIAVGAFIRVPVPVVPFTLQFLFTMLAGVLLGGRLGATSVSLYVLMGLAGLPVFAEGGGIGYILKPSFGYLIGFCVGTYVTGVIAHKVAQPSFNRLLLASLTGLGIVYVFGLIYYYIL